MTFLLFFSNVQNLSFCIIVVRKIFEAINKENVVFVVQSVIFI